MLSQSGLTVGRISPASIFPRFTPEALARAFEDEEGEEEDDFGRDPW